MSDVKAAAERYRKGGYTYVGDLVRDSHILADAYVNSTSPPADVVERLVEALRSLIPASAALAEHAKTTGVFLMKYFDEQLTDCRAALTAYDQWKERQHNEG